MVVRGGRELPPYHREIPKKEKAHQVKQSNRRGRKLINERIGEKRGAVTAAPTRGGHIDLCGKESRMSFQRGVAGAWSHSSSGRMEGRRPGRRGEENHSSAWERS